MSPPPPPLGRSRRRGSRSDQHFDPALDDVELAGVRDQLAQGRWSEARTLLAATGDDWDRRGHRAVVLAQASGAVAWTRDWLVVEPRSSDAATLFACANVIAALRGKEPEYRARDTCREAIRRAPADPTPGSVCCSSPARWARRKRPCSSSTRSAPGTRNTTTRTI